MYATFRPLVALAAIALAGEFLGSARAADDEAKDAIVERPATDGLQPAIHAKVRKYAFGVGPRSYWLFEPADPKPERAPVVVFLHGWFSVNPAIYGGWIDHLVLGGSTVVFPRYQNDVGTMPRDFLPNALAAIHDALAVLSTGEGHVRPDLNRFALIGHSAGGNLAAQVAALSSDKRSGLPEVRATVVVMPGEVVPDRSWSVGKIPASTVLIVAVGEEDVVVGDHRGRQIFEQAAVPRSRKRYVFFRSDRHGYPPLIAEHTAPTSANPRLDDGEGFMRAFQLSKGDVNVFDRGGFWKLGDVALRAGFAGQTLDEAIPDPEKFAHLGYWSDGRKVAPLVLSDDLHTAPRVLLSNGLRIISWDRFVKVGDASREVPDASRLR